MLDERFSTAIMDAAFIACLIIAAGIGFLFGRI